jgi:hypothetical protein
LALDLNRSELLQDKGNTPRILRGRALGPKFVTIDKGKACLQGQISNILKGEKSQRMKLLNSVEATGASFPEYVIPHMTYAGFQI